MESYLIKHLFLYADARLYQVCATHLEPKEFAQGDSFPPGIIIIGREHTAEKLNKFPVTDLGDLKAILKHEFSSGTITSTPVVNQSDSEVFSWQLNAETKKRLQSGFTLWVPETLILNPVFGKVNIMERAGSRLLMLQHGKLTYSSIASGALSDPEYFLMTLGLPKMEEHRWLEEDYVEAIVSGLRRLKVQDISSILFAQKHIIRSVKQWHWKSAAAGVVLGWSLMTAFNYGQLTYRLHQDQSELENQNIREIVQTKKDIEQKVVLLNQLSASNKVANQDKQLWHVLASIMEAKLTIIRFRTNAQGVQVRLESDIATEGLEAIKKMPGVESAAFAAAVQNSLGKQRFTVDIVFSESMEGSAANGQS